MGPGQSLPCWPGGMGRRPGAQGSVMFQVECPYCDRIQGISEQTHGRNVKCPGCGRFFQADRTLARPPATPPAAPPLPETSPSAPAVLLTAPHRCQVVSCRQVIEQPVGRTRDTIVCPHCDNPTSIYAVLHHCPHCRVLLESPLRDGGRETACPRCRQTLLVPEPLLSRRDSPEAPGHYFIPCPTCRCTLQTAPRSANHWSVCPNCRHSFRIPPHGESSAPAVVLPDAEGTLLESVRRICPRCRQHIPTRANRCPNCD